jgi:hypothetical protein
MFVGHFALGFAAKRAAPSVSLGVLIAAAQFADVLWPILIATGIGQVRIDPGNTAFTPLDFISYPYSHSLSFLLIWGIVLGGAYRLFTRHNGLSFGVIALLVASHWVLDVVTHRPDMPLYPGGPRLGLALWNSVPWTVLVELVLYALGVWIYWRATRARDAIGRWAFVGLALFLLIAYVGSIAGGAPPSEAAIWATAIVGSVLILVWSAWADRHRELAGTALSA